MPTSPLTASALVAAHLLASASVASAQLAGASHDLGSFGGGAAEARAVSRDGALVVGWAEDPNGTPRAFRWSAARGLVDLGAPPGAASHAFGISAAGDVVVGAYTPATSGNERAFRWSAADGFQDLGTLGGASSRAHGVSGDGVVVVGESRTASGARRAFRWSAATGMTALAGLPGFTEAAAFAADADGDTVVGAARLPGLGGPAVRWPAAGGVEQVTHDWGQALAVSADGAVVVGETESVAFLWRPSSGAHLIHAYPASWSSWSLALTPDASAVVGFASDPSGTQRAARWTDATGLWDPLGTSLELPTLGGPASAAHGVDADGGVVVGWSLDAAGRRRAFRWTAHAFGERFCEARPNHTGRAALLAVGGSDLVAANALALGAEFLPTDTFACFLTSRDRTLPYAVAGTSGVLCLGGFIGRYVGPGLVRDSGSTGAVALTVDLANVPTSLGSVAASAGETWHFQLWYRDLAPGPTSNFSDAVGVLLR